MNTGLALLVRARKVRLTYNRSIPPTHSLEGLPEALSLPLLPSKLTYVLNQQNLILRTPSYHPVRVGI